MPGMSLPLMWFFNLFGIGNTDSPPVPVMDNALLTEDGNLLLTESGLEILLE